MEHRKENRTPLLVYLDIIECQTQQSLGYLGDVSTNGMMLISPKPLDVGQVLDIRIELPDTNSLNFEHAGGINLQVELVWKKPNLNPELSCLGCHFTQITETDRELLQQVGQTLGFHQEVEVHRVSA